MAGHRNARLSREELLSKLAALEVSTTERLRERWQAVFRRMPPRTLSRDVLLRALTWQLQASALGGLPPRVVSALKRESTTVAREPRDQVLKPGTRLVRVWHGTTHQVLVLESGFEVDGRRFESLSAIARQITGTRWSGPRFFGLDAH